MTRPVKPPREVWVVTWLDEFGTARYFCYRVKKLAELHIKELVGYSRSQWVCDEPIGPYTLGGGE